MVTVLMLLLYVPEAKSRKPSSTSTRASLGSAVPGSVVFSSLPCRSNPAKLSGSSGAGIAWAITFCEDGADCAASGRVTQDGASRAATTRNERRTGRPRSNITLHFTLLMLPRAPIPGSEVRLVGSHAAAVLRDSQPAQTAHIFSHPAVER